MISQQILLIKKIADVEFDSVVSFSEIIDNKLRIYLIDKSFIDIYLSQVISGRFAFHWEREQIDKTIYRYDNFPDVNWKNRSTFPYHFHQGSQDKVISSSFSKEIIPGFRDFMKFVSQRIKEIGEIDKSELA